MKILFVGPYRQNDGWGNAAQGYLRALQLTGHDIVARPIYLNGQKTFSEQTEFDRLEAKTADYYDVIIQNTLPSYYVKYGTGKNIGLSFFESTIAYTPWVEPINLMDEIWVTSFFEKTQLEKSGITTSIKQVKIPFDTTKYNSEAHFAPLDRFKHEFKFYFVGEFITRKNLRDLIIAFHTEFDVNEPVRLVIKTSLTGQSSDVVFDRVARMISETKMSLGIHQREQHYKQELVFTDFLSDEDLLGLHNDCQCLVVPSSGEAFCMPIVDALMSKSIVISNLNSGMPFHYQQNQLAAHSRLVPAIAPDRPLPYLYTSKDYWYKINVDDLRKKMRQAYDSGYNENCDLSKVADEYKYETIAKKIKAML